MQWAAGPVRHRRWPERSAPPPGSGRAPVGSRGDWPAIGWSASPVSVWVGPDVEHPDLPPPELRRRGLVESGEAGLGGAVGGHPLHRLVRNDRADVGQEAAGRQQSGRRPRDPDRRDQVDQEQPVQHVVVKVGDVAERDHPGGENDAVQRLAACARVTSRSGTPAAARSPVAVSSTASPSSAASAASRSADRPCRVSTAPCAASCLLIGAPSPPVAPMTRTCAPASVVMITTMPSAVVGSPPDGPADEVRA